MWNYFRFSVILLICTAQVIVFAGCNAKNTSDIVPVVDVQTPDTRVPELTPSEVAQFMNQYAISADLKATAKTVEILSELDAWPDKMCEFVLLLPAEQIPDEIYEKLANSFFRDLNYDQMARFLELCFDTYEYTEGSGSVLLKINTAKYEKIRYSMEQLVKNDNYDNRDMLHRYGLFTSVKYIPALISTSPASIQAFSVVENADHIYTNYKEKDYTFVLNSFILNYIGANQKDRSETPQHVKVFQTAMDTTQLHNLSAFFIEFSLKKTEEALRTGNSSMVEEAKKETKSESGFCIICAQSGYAYTKVDFSDESIWPLRMVFPKESTANIFQYGEERVQEDESILIVAEPWSVEMLL